MIKNKKSQEFPAGRRFQAVRALISSVLSLFPMSGLRRGKNGHAHILPFLCLHKALLPYVVTFFRQAQRGSKQRKSAGEHFWGFLGTCQGKLKTMNEKVRKIYTLLDEQSIRRVFQAFLARFWPRFLARLLTRFSAGVLTRFWPPKIQCAVLLGRRNTVYSSTGTEKYSITIPFTIYYLISKRSRHLFQVLYNTI